MNSKHSSILLDSLLPSNLLCLSRVGEAAAAKRIRRTAPFYPAAPRRSVRSQPVDVRVYPSELDELVITPHPLAAGKNGITWT